MVWAQAGADRGPDPHHCCSPECGCRLSGRLHPTWTAETLRSALPQSGSDYEVGSSWTSSWLGIFAAGFDQMGQPPSERFVLSRAVRAGAAPIGRAGAHSSPISGFSSSHHFPGHSVTFPCTAPRTCALRRTARLQAGRPVCGLRCGCRARRGPRGGRTAGKSGCAKLLHITRRSRRASNIRIWPRGGGEREGASLARH